MKYIKFWANMLLIPAYVILFYCIRIPEITREMIAEIVDAIRSTKRKYGIK